MARLVGSLDQNGDSADQMSQGLERESRGSPWRTMNDGPTAGDDHVRDSQDAADQRRDACGFVGWWLCGDDVGGRGSVRPFRPLGRRLPWPQRLRYLGTNHCLLSSSSFSTTLQHPNIFLHLLQESRRTTYSYRHACAATRAEYPSDTCTLDATLLRSFLDKAKSIQLPFTRDGW